MPELAPTSLIIGCGYLGRSLAAKLIAEGQTVYGTTRSFDHAPALTGLGVQPLVVSVTQPVTFAAMRPALEAGSLDVYYMVPPGRPGRRSGHPTPRQTVLGGIAHMVKQLRYADTHRALLVSSSAVYGQRDGQHVDADTEPEPSSERGRLLLEGERLWLAAGDGYRVVRLAGLYGPHRVIGMSAVSQNAPLVGDPQALLNLIHADDAIALLLAMMRADHAGRIELGCDGHPVARIEYYAYLAELLKVPPPRVLDDASAAEGLGLNLERLRRSSSKALDNIATCRRTGWSPYYPTFRQGLAAILREEALRQNRP